MDDFFRLLAKAWPYLVTVSPALWLLYDRWTQGKRAKTTDRKELIQIAQEAAGEVIDELREETGRLRKRLEEVERELLDLQKRHTTMIADKDAKITLLEGEKQQLLAKIGAYERLFAQLGIEPPKQSQAYWVTEDRHIIPSAERPIEGRK